MTNRKSFRYLPLCLIACVSVALGLAAPVAGGSSDEEIRESAVCLDCHDGHDQTLAWTAHALKLEGEPSADSIACTDCHGTNSAHWEDDPEENSMVNPSFLSVAEEARLCGSCHQGSHQQSMLERNVHAGNGIHCSSCHSIHEGDEQTTLLKDQQPALCYDCHGEVEGEFARSYRHPVNLGIMQCTECHSTLDETRRELSNEVGGLCIQCHAEFAGPYPFEHQAALDFSTEEGGCLACHAAHGSEHPMLLQQPYEPPHFQLCSQCHMVPSGHLSNAQHGTAWMGIACNECHSDIHGSFTSRYFLSESLAAEGCTKAGCHGD